MKASDLREKSVEDLRELQASLAHDTFQNRLKNFTNRLDDTSLIKKAKRDLARVKTVLTQRATKAKAAAVAAEPVKAPVAAAPKVAKPAKVKSAPKAEAKSTPAVAPAAEKPAAAKKTATKKTAKKSEAE
jgi:large subunit ribosomal protein L29